MEIEVWSDVVCPWCFVGKRNLEAALRAFPRRDAVAVRWRSFELDPGAPAVRDGGYVERLAGKYHVSLEDAQAMVDRMARTGAAVGIDFRFDLARPGNTFAAHRLLHLGHRLGLQDALKERLFLGTFTEGAPVGTDEALHRLAVEAGLDGEEVAAVLASDHLAEEVRADEREAATLGITAVPYFVIDRRYGVAGAQPPAVLRQALEQAWAARSGASVALAERRDEEENEDEEDEGGGCDGGAGPEGDVCAT